MLHSVKSYLVILWKILSCVKVKKEMACDVSPVAMFKMFINGFSFLVLNLSLLGLNKEPWELKGLKKVMIGDHMSNLK